MVTRLELPAIDDDDYITGVVRERQAGINAAYFTGILEKWQGWVRAYVRVHGDPAQIPASPIRDTDKNKFHNLYTGAQDDSVHGAELKKLRDGKPQFCPACGEPGQPNTLDHYLPKELFAEFSITPANLFPMCDTCQGFKGVLTVDEAGLRYFIHPYFDDFARDQLLLIKFQAPFDAPTMTLRVNLAPDSDAYQLTHRHIEKLRLETRVQHFMRDEYSHLLRLAQDTRKDGGDVRANLHQFARMYRARSVNRWEHIWYASVLADNALVTYLAEEPLPLLR
ncbi:hypothetical protein [uncultured Xanthomonas sp.]|uniref:hypothetical protein n=1 Tax=uncultured Xanthomonas sp. TaxID=152831 RepID=UPI0025ED1F69|nr:hypothetical protein [uncultured Xanthomonas sp.]